MTTTNFDPDAICTACEQPRSSHGPSTRHPFTDEDQPDWVPPQSENKPKPTTRAAGQIIVAPAPDLALRALLVRHGLIAMEELREVEDGLRYPGQSASVPHAGAAEVASDEANPGGN